MRKLNFRKRRPGSVADPDTLLATAYESPRASSHLVVPAGLAAFTLMAFAAVADGHGWAYVLAAAVLGFAAVVLALRGLDRIRRVPVFELREGYLARRGQRLPYNEVTAADLGLSPLEHSWFWRQWSLELRWRNDEYELISWALADHNHLIALVLPRLPGRVRAAIDPDIRRFGRRFPRLPRRSPTPETPRAR